MQLSGAELKGRLAPLFEENFTKFGELGAAVSLWQNGQAVLDLHGGFRDARREQSWTPDTLVLVWSMTKGIGSACLLHALQENKIDLGRRVAEFWPEFAQNGKNEITLAQLMSHSAGLCALDENADVTDYPAVIRALEQQRPLWLPATEHGYHARTFGFLIDEMTRRISGSSISKYWRAVFGEPLALDFWIGLPAELNSRCATIYAAKLKTEERVSLRPKIQISAETWGRDEAPPSDDSFGALPEPQQFYRDLTIPGTIQRRTFTSPYGLHAVSAMNKPENRALDIVSFGGIGSASALGKFYAMLANGGEMDGQRFFSDKTLALMSTTIADGIDRVFEIPTAFAAGFMKDSVDSPRRTFGPSGKAFGHPGAGGSHAYADPENRIAFAYVMNQMEQTLLPDEKSLRLVDAIYPAR
jgi:CubicO group peptidase (beta-lactamase class C family)